MHDDGGARLFRYAAPRRAALAEAASVLLIPSMLQRATVLDLAPGASLVDSLSGAGLDVFALDWGPPHALDRHFGLDDAIDRIRRARRAVRRLTGDGVSVVGYSQGGTLAAISTAVHPEGVAALVNVAGPIDFTEAGPLSRFVDARWCDADAIADAGQATTLGFRALVAAMAPAQARRPYALAATEPDPEARGIWRALVRWADDPVTVPAEVLRVWVKELYQGDALVRGALRIGGVPVRLDRIEAPVLIISPERDDVCPFPAAAALARHVASARADTLRVPGGHVSGVVGPGARERLHLPLARWLKAHASRRASAQRHAPIARPAP